MLKYIEIYLLFSVSFIKLLTRKFNKFSHCLKKKNFSVFYAPFFVVNGYFGLFTISRITDFVVRYRNPLLIFKTYRLLTESSVHFQTLDVR